VDPGSELAAQLRPSIGDERVLEAIAQLPRDRFVPVAERGRAWENCALPISCGQTISQPLVVARMLELLELGPSDIVLDVGTGSGYHAALLSRLAGRVFTIERHAALAEEARRTLAELELEDIEVFVGDGGDGLPEYSPFDAINVAAAPGETLPEALERQLARGGRLVAPVGESEQRLLLARRTERGLERVLLETVRFVPLVRGATD
jgi:protein-L-isoaspartate(D-aspartate) O-methyltransferase